MDENEQELKSPIKRLGSTRKLLVFNSKYIFYNECILLLNLQMLFSGLFELYRQSGIFRRCTQFYLQANNTY